MGKFEESGNLFKRTKSTVRERFSIIQNEILQNNVLSFQAKGFLCYILSLPDDWILHKSYIRSTFGVGREKLNGILRELQDAGYMAEIEMVRAEDGSFIKPSYLFYDEPIAKKPHSEQTTPVTGLPSTGEPSTVNRQLQRTNTNKELSIDKTILFNKFWELYDKKVGKTLAMAEFNKLSDEEISIAIEHAPKYRQARDKQFMKDPVRYLRNKVWQDELVLPEPAKQKGAQPYVPLTEHYSYMIPDLNPE